MIDWLHIVPIAAFSTLILVLLLHQIFQRFLNPKTRVQGTNQVNPILDTQCTNQVGPTCNLDTQSSRDTDCDNISPNFCWADHPSFLSDALENGWPGFRFESTETNVEISWEGPSHYYMQKVRLKKTANSSLRVIRTALPLPGPRLKNSFFPQQPYFEITILSSELIGENESAFLAVGLTGGGHLPLKCPGMSPGSIGFNSTGSVFVNGKKLVLECKKNEWGRAESVIGVGYNPMLQRIFFTLNSQLLHVIHCKSQEFGHPLFPTIAANTDDVTLVLNLGQKPFRFELGNSQRTPNPCFVRPQRLEDCRPVMFEDSADLFSLGEMDSIWKHWATITCNNNTANSFKDEDSDQDSDDDLFEIRIGH